MKSKSSKLLIDIRARLKVQEDSLEAWISKYLNDEDATPYVRHRLILDSLITHFAPLVYEYQGATPEAIRQSLIDANQAWQGHFRYLQQRLGINLNSPLPTPQEAERNYILPESEPSLTPLTEEEEEGDYPTVF